MKNFLMFLFLIILSCSCVTPLQLPSVCDTITDSQLCVIANQLGVRLETIGLTLVVISTKCIDDNYITKQTVKDIVTNLIAVLDVPITYIVFKDKLLEYEQTYPTLILVTKEYLTLFAANQLISEVDKNILRSWLTTQLLKLEES